MTPTQPLALQARRRRKPSQLARSDHIECKRNARLSSERLFLGGALFRWSSLAYLSYQECAKRDRDLSRLPNLKNRYAISVCQRGRLL